VSRQTRGLDKQQKAEQALKLYREEYQTILDHQYFFYQARTNQQQTSLESTDLFPLNATVLKNKLSTIATDVQKIEFLYLSSSSRIERQLLLLKIKNFIELQVCDFESWNLDPNFHFLSQILNIKTHAWPLNRLAIDQLLALYSAVPSMLKQHKEQLENALNQQNIAPQRSVLRLIDKLKEFIKDPKKSPWLLSLDDFPTDMNIKERDAYHKKITLLYKEQITPAIKQYILFLKTKIQPKSRKTHPGLEGLTLGKACYQAQIRYFLGTQNTPEELADIGKNEIDKTKAQIRSMLTQIAAESPSVTKLNMAYIKKSILQVTSSLIYQKQAIDRATQVIKNMHQQLLPLIGNIPPYEITLSNNKDSVHSEFLQIKTPSHMQINIEPLSKKIHLLQAFIFRETFPGKQWLANQLISHKDWPAFRKQIDSPLILVDPTMVFVEGWALYAASLAQESGLYSSRRDELGFYYESLLAAYRLVLDCSIHAFGMNREQAIKFLADGLGTTDKDPEIEQEVDHIIGQPGQGLMAKIGELEIKHLRMQAEQKLGPRFNLSAFHRAIYEHGALPLPLLNQVIEEWIQKQQKIQ